MQWTFDLTGIREVAASLWQAAGQYKIFAFHGEMGAGKTTFVHALCDVKGVRSPVGSPTFSLVNAYSFFNNGKEEEIFHIDLYRIKDEEEALQAGIEDCLYSGAWCFVEWPERAPGIFPEETVHVFISALPDGLRTLILRFPGGN